MNNYLEYIEEKQKGAINLRGTSVDNNKIITININLNVNAGDKITPEAIETIKQLMDVIKDKPADDPQPVKRRWLR